VNKHHKGSTEGPLAQRKGNGTRGPTTKKKKKEPPTPRKNKQKKKKKKKTTPPRTESSTGKCNSRGKKGDGGPEKKVATLLGVISGVKRGGTGSTVLPAPGLKKKNRPGELVISALGGNELTGPQSPRRQNRQGQLREQKKSAHLNKRIRRGERGGGGAASVEFQKGTEKQCRRRQKRKKGDDARGKALVRVGFFHGTGQRGEQGKNQRWRNPGVKRPGGEGQNQKG